MTCFSYASHSPQRVLILAGRLPLRPDRTIECRTDLGCHFPTNGFEKGKVTDSKLHSSSQTRYIRCLIVRRPSWSGSMPSCRRIRWHSELRLVDGLCSTSRPPLDRFINQLSVPVPIRILDDLR